MFTQQAHQRLFNIESTLISLQEYVIMSEWCKGHLAMATKHDFVFEVFVKYCK